MVTHHWIWAYKRTHTIETAIASPHSFNIEVRRWTDEQLALLILAGDDPRAGGLARSVPRLCRCPKVGRYACKRCMGEGRYYNGVSDYIPGETL